jgi:hypothetical protein
MPWEESQRRGRLIRVAVYYFNDLLTEPNLSFSVWLRIGSSPLTSRQHTRGTCVYRKPGRSGDGARQRMARELITPVR